MTSLAAAGMVALAAVAVGWPVARRRTGRRLLGRARHRRQWRSGAKDLAALRKVGTGPGGGWSHWLLAAFLAALAAVAGGIVAGIVVAGYAAAAVRALARRRAQLARARRRTHLLDALALAAADLRAGLAPGAALAGPLMADRGDPLAQRAAAAVSLADQTGAPLAEVLERLEADARSAERARAGAVAQAAGSRATAWLLTALPAGGIGLGYAIGADPLRVLLRTPIGAGCALAAMALQLAGLAWAGRIGRPREIS